MRAQHQNLRDLFRNTGLVRGYALGVLILAAGCATKDPIVVGGVGPTFYGRPDLVGENRAYVLTEALELTPVQAHDITLIFINEQVDLRALGDLPPRAETKPIRREVQEKIRALLTPAQRAKFNLITEWHGGGLVGLSPWDRVARLDRLVHLSDAQQAAALRIYVGGTELLMESHDTAQAADVRNIVQMVKGQIRALLTSEQQVIWEGAPKAQGGGI